MLKRRWDKFMCPNGIRRTFNPKKWEHGTPVLVFGELLALGSAIAAIPNWPYDQWFLYAAPIIAAGALVWYALDKSSLGEMPLTNVSAKRIANVVRLVNTEEKLGPVVEWDTIKADATSAGMDLSKMKPEIKTHVAQMVRDMILGSDTPRALGIDLAQADDDTILGRLTEIPTTVTASGGDESEPQV